MRALTNISVVMPLRNAEPFVDAAITSIVGQTYPDWELVIVDDSSNDDTLDIVLSHQDNDPRIRVLVNEVRQGIGASLNRAIADCASPLIARMDGDDLSDRDRLRRQARLMERKKVVLCGSGARIIDSEGNLIRTYQPPEADHDIRVELLSDNPFVHTSVMFRRGAFERVGGYPTQGYFEDYRLWIRLAQCGAVANLSDLLVSHRVHADSVTRSLPRTRQRLARMGAQIEAARSTRNWRAAVGPLARTSSALALGWVKHR